MSRIKIGVIGAGAIAQIEHVPNLLRLKDQFQLIGICDPSATARDFIANRYGLATFETAEALLQLPLDAVAVASPDPLHKEHVLAAFDRGLHVFCEKPLCYSRQDIEDLIAVRDSRKLVLQVGYMKRFDPSYEAALDLLPGTARNLRRVTVEVTDPDAGPFIRHHDWGRGGDVPPALMAVAAEKQKAQVARAVRMPLDAVGFRGFCAAYCSSLVHDVNAVLGLLDRLGLPEGEIVGAQLYDGGGGGHGAVRLGGGQALWTMNHLRIPELPDYRECITFQFDDAALELEFPSPWLNHQPTRLTIRRGDGHQLHAQNIRTSYEEAFVEELKGFWSSVAEGMPSRNAAEQAARDMDLLCGFARWHATHSPEPVRQGVFP